MSEYSTSSRNYVPNEVDILGLIAAIKPRDLRNQIYTWFHNDCWLIGELQDQIKKYQLDNSRLRNAIRISQETGKPVPGCFE